MTQTGASGLKSSGLRSKNLAINVNCLTRVEGHGNIIVNIRDGVLEKCNLEIIESPRYFESMLRGRPYRNAWHLASRICGICSVAHTLTSIRAVEKALGIEVSPQTELLRKLCYYGEMLDSHILHIYMLVAPDLLGVGSIIPLVESAPQVVARALRMKKVAGDICAAVAGRHTHPIAMTIGGFTHFPEKSVLNNLAERLEAIRADVDDTVELFQRDSSGPELPGFAQDFARDTEYIALCKENEYAFTDGQIASLNGIAAAVEKQPVENYRQVANEFLVSHSTAKHARHQRQSYMVGALARFNINHDQLHPRAQAAAQALGLGLGTRCTNPYMITMAQVVEILHCVEQAIKIVRDLLALRSGSGPAWEQPIQPARFSGEGVGACEAAHGTLYHHYVITNGYVAEANCITPTGQNLANIEADMRSLASKLVGTATAAEITLALEMLVRAYDPCISCSTH